MRSGVYQITWPSGHYYVGSSSDLDRRKRTHANRLKGRRHVNPHMQAVFNKYGPGRFEVLELCPPEEVREIEQEHLDREFEEGSKLFLNISTNAIGGRGKWSDQSRAKLSKTRTGMKFSDEHRANIARARRESWYKEPEDARRARVAKISKSHARNADGIRVTFPDGRVEEYETQKALCQAYDIGRPNVNRYLKGRNPSKASPLHGAKLERVKK